MEETLVHFERQLFILFWIHYRQRTERNYTFRKYPGTFWMFSLFFKSNLFISCQSIIIIMKTNKNVFSWIRQVREVPDRNKPNCFELYATGGNDFIKGTNAQLHANRTLRKTSIYNSNIFGSFQKNKSLQNGFRGESGGGQAHCLPNVRCRASWERRMDCMH